MCRAHMYQVSMRQVLVRRRKRITRKVRPSLARLVLFGIADNIRYGTLNTAFPELPELLS
jgi:hypothetical protein